MGLIMAEGGMMGSGVLLEESGEWSLESAFLDDT